MAKLTVEDLLARKMKIAGNTTKTIEIAELGGEITLIKQPLKTILRIMDDFDRDAGMSVQMDVFANLIYKCVPLFQDKKLQDAYECAEPTDIVYKVFDDNLNAIATVGKDILDMYGVDADGMKNEIKN